MTLGKIKTVLWDLDNTLYPYTDDQIENWHQACVRAAMDMGVRVDFEDGMEKARQSFAEYNFSGTLFQKEHGLCHREMHPHIMKHAREDLLPVCEITPRAFAARPDLQHVIVTHANKEWAERVLAHLGLREYFEDRHILGLDDYDFAYKHAQNDGILMALDRVGGNADETMFAEDTLPNLAKAKEEGVHTVYIHHGMFAPQNDNTPDYVDFHFDTARDFLFALAQADEASSQSEGQESQSA